MIVSSRAYGLIYYDNKFCFTDSDSCGSKGKGGVQNGKACIIECDTIDKFIRNILQTVHSNADTQFSINAINVVVKEIVLPMEQYLQEHLPIQVNYEIPTENKLESVNTSVPL